jgi:L-threonylcarbamoyladenylate synthase
VSPTRAEHVSKDLDGRINLILDAGPSPFGIESTVLDLTFDPPRLLRPGVITASQLGSVLGVEVTRLDAREAGQLSMSSPGQMEVHYAPRAIVELVDLDSLSSFAWPNGRRYGVIAAGHGLTLDLSAATRHVMWIDPALAASELYSTLHRWDEEAIEFIYVVLPPDDDAWRAVRDRLWRASRRWAREGHP